MVLRERRRPGLLALGRLQLCDLLLEKLDGLLERDILSPEIVSLLRESSSIVVGVLAQEGNRSAWEVGARMPASP